MIVRRFTSPLGNLSLSFNQLGLVEVNYEHAIQFRVPQGV